MTGVWAIFACCWPLGFILVAMCNVDWNDRGGL